MKAFRPHIERAIALHGSQVKLAKEVGCSQQYISWLLNEAEQISAEMAVAFDRATKGEVSRHDLRPDIFGPKPVEALPPHDVDRVATAGPDGGPSESGPAFSQEAAE